MQNQLITARDPLKEYGISNLWKLRQSILEGLRPAFPQTEDYSAYGLVNEHSPLWHLLNRCWMERPEDRPSINDVIEKLKTALP